MSVDIVGKVYERFTVVAVTDKRTRQKSRLYQCICNCGNEFFAIRWDLEHGKVTSCGCYRRLGVSRKETGKATFNRLYRVYKRGASSRNYAFELSESEFKKLIGSECHYCGRLPESILKSEYNNGDLVYNGIDRIDNSKGYLLGNCVSCCGKCNGMKSTMNYKDFIDLCKKIAERF